MAQRGRNERCPCGSGRKIKRCCGVRRGPSEAEQAKALLHQQAQAAALVLHDRSELELAAVFEQALDLPTQDVAMQLSLPWVAGSGVERLRAAIAAGDADVAEAAMPAAVAEVDTPLARAELVSAAQGLCDAGQVLPDVTAAVAVELASRSTTLLRSCLVEALFVTTGTATTPAGLLVAGRS
jgi:SEC-C motif